MSDNRLTPAELAELEALERATRSPGNLSDYQDCEIAARLALPRLLAEVMEGREKGKEQFASYIAQGNRLAEIEADCDDLRAKLDEKESARQQVSKRLGEVCDDWDKLHAENVNLRAKLEQAEQLHSDVRGLMIQYKDRAERAEAEVVELRKTLHLIVEGDTPTTSVDFHEAKEIAAEALSAPNHGQPLLDELEGLRKVEAAARRLFAVVRAADMAYNDDDECLGATVNPDGTAMRLAASALEALDQLRAGREGGK